MAAEEDQNDDDKGYDDFDTITSPNVLILRFRFITTGTPPTSALEEAGPSTQPVMTLDSAPVIKRKPKSMIMINI